MEPNPYRELPEQPFPQNLIGKVVICYLKDGSLNWVKGRLERVFKGVDDRFYLQIGKSPPMYYVALSEIFSIKLEK